MIGGRRYDLRRYGRIVVVGAGKATASMARAMEPMLGPRLEQGLVIVKYGHALPTRRIAVKEAGHPLPDRAGLRAAALVREMAGSSSARDLLIVLLSGGASSLMPAPVPGVSLEEKQRITQQLLRSGADIEEINLVRKHLSLLKGGRLAQFTQATIVTLILSDVLGDDLSAIASGPTAPDPTTFRQAVNCLKRYGLWSTAPAGVRAHLDRGKRGLVPETPKSGASLFRRVHNCIIGRSADAVAAAAQAARQAGLNTVIHPTMLTGEARLAGAAFAGIARRIVKKARAARRPCCIIAPGETTVTVKGSGRGGRAQEFAVAAAEAIAGLDGVSIVAVGTDGTDGPTDVAGAVVDGRTMRRAGRLGIDLERALRENDTYPALSRLSAHIRTGPTNTNVNDLYLLLVL